MWLCMLALPLFILLIYDAHGFVTPNSDSRLAITVAET